MAGKQENQLKLKREFKTKNKKKRISKQQSLFCIIHYTKQKSGKEAQQKSEKEVRPLTEVSLKKSKSQLKFGSQGKCK